ncbi:hypothetical protein A5780_04010 [Nocardia sp. 852002-20019_SCH5090214]|nr:MULTISPECIES: DUF2231 domain-containing protein [Nocardia]OBF69165.1 hypothetical protein A9X06_32725 [Mycobacterium sp. 852002-51759_SCH5129042]MBV7701297.1 DUF2231 domain-containing protein [Nocardia nova]OBA43653.1 hypothetical protein A5780_04010 [Nocardia sp. 852002-20019_SCH5090214]OBA48218.1 hypothetical protein A5789_34110 [Nocardia sp. 852002-51101_SCH5132738]OBB30564.1 hypothetical protein A5748_08745 [Nocardia sp. 852002-51244_SCH5132740]
MAGDVAAGDMEQAKQPVSAALAGPYGHPFHPILVTVPIGAWVASLVFDIGSHIVDDPQFLARGAEWLVAIGVLGALAAASIGFLDLFAIPSGTPAFRTGLIHMSLNLIITVAYALNFWWRTAAGTDRATPVGPLVLSIASLLVLGISGYLGGKLAYRYGVRVAGESTQATGYRR